MRRLHPLVACWFANQAFGSAALSRSLMKADRRHQSQIETTFSNPGTYQCHLGTRRQDLLSRRIEKSLN